MASWVLLPIADLVGLLCCYFAGWERLPDLKKQGSTLYGPAHFRLVLTLYQQKLSGSRGRIAESFFSRSDSGPHRAA